MSNMAPDLSGLDPFINAFIVVAVLGAVISLVIIGQTLLSFAASRLAQVARRGNIPTDYRQPITSH